MPVTGMYELCMNGTKVEKLSSDCVLLWSPSAACTYAVSAYMTGTVLALPSHIAALPLEPLKSSKAPTNYFTPNILRKSWSRLVVSVVHLDALAFPVAAT